MSFQPIVCKLELNGDIRRFRLETPSYAEVVRIAIRRFGLTEPALLRLVFTDPDGDLITISSDSSLQDAISCADSLLRLSLVPSKTPLFVNQEPVTSSVNVTKNETLENKIQRKIAHLRAIRHRLAFRQQSVNRWSERVRREDGHARVEAVRQKLAAHLAQLEMRAKFLADKHPAHAAEFLAAVAEPTAEAMIAMAQPEAQPSSGIVITCDGCESVIQMTDIRYNCEDCWNFDLCESCEGKNIHDPSHVLRKMRPEAQQTHPPIQFHRRFGRPFGCPRRFHGQHNPIVDEANAPSTSDDAHRFPHGGCPRFHHGFGRRAFHCHRFSGVPMTDSAATASAPADPVSVVVDFVKETVIPLVQTLPGTESIPVVDVADDLIATTQRMAPELIAAIAEIVPRIFKAHGPKTIDNLDWGVIIAKIHSMPTPSQELIDALGAKLQEHLADLEDLLPNLMAGLIQKLDPVNLLARLQAAQMTAAAPQPFLKPDVLSSIRTFRPLRPACRRPRREQLNSFFAAQNAATPAPRQPEEPVVASQPNLTADVVLAALSVPAETMAQIIQQSNNDPQIALALWEAMQD